MTIQTASALDALIPRPRLAEIDCVDVSAPADAVWRRVRHGALAQSRVTRGLFAVRTMIGRWKGEEPPPDEVRLDDMRSSADRPGFQVLIDEPPHEVVVGAIGQVWRLEIPFVHVASATEYAAFAVPHFVKVAWAIRVSPRPAQSSHVELEVRVDATDDAAWIKFKRYFRVIGPASRFIRRTLLRSLVGELGRDERGFFREEVHP